MRAHWIWLVLVAVSPQVFAEGGVRDGGDEIIKTPIWSCRSGDGKYVIEMPFGERKATLKDTVAKREVTFEGLYKELMLRDAHFELSPGNHWSKPLGFTQSYSKLANSERVFALSVYLEKRLTDFADHRRENLFQGRFAARWDGQLIKGVELRCRYYFPALHYDPVDTIR